MPLMDNSDLFERHDAEQERELRKLPVCCCCGDPIQQEQAVCFNGNFYCEDCEDEAWELIRKEYLEDISE